MAATPPPALRLSDEVLELLDSGVDVIVATTDATLAPETAWGMGLRVHRDRRRVTIFVARVLAADTLRNIADNGQIAVTFSRPVDHVVVQLKGRVLDVHDSEPADRPVQERYRGAFAEQLAQLGIPRAITRRFAWWPSVAIEFEVREAFMQTPGPRAGDPIPGCTP